MLGIQLDLTSYFSRLSDELRQIDQAAAGQLADWLFEAYQSGRTVFIIGNGGSAANASHMCEDLAKCSLTDEELRADGVRRLKILSLGDNTPWITAIGNDCGYDQVFVQQLKHFGQPGDVLVAISGSGNSKNILAAVEWANRAGLRTFGLTGYDGGKLKSMAQAGLHVQIDDMGIVESVHSCLLHWLVGDLHARIHATGRYATK